MQWTAPLLFPVREKGNIMQNPAKKELKFPITPRFLSENGAMVYTSLGRDSVRKWCKEIGAVRRIGKRVMYDRLAIDSAMDKLAPIQDKEV